MKVPGYNADDLQSVRLDLPEHCQDFLAGMDKLDVEKNAQDASEGLPMRIEGPFMGFLEFWREVEERSCWRTPPERVSGNCDPSAFPAPSVLLTQEAILSESQMLALSQLSLPLSDPLFLFFLLSSCSTRGSEAVLPSKRQEAPPSRASRRTSLALRRAGVLKISRPTF